MSGTVEELGTTGIERPFGQEGGQKVRSHRTVLLHWGNVLAKVTNFIDNFKRSFSLFFPFGVPVVWRGDLLNSMR
jgi:hypothetical protein